MHAGPPYTQMQRPTDVKLCLTTLRFQHKIRCGFDDQAMATTIVASQKVLNFAGESLTRTIAAISLIKAITMGPFERHVAEVRILRNGNYPECEVVVNVRGREMVIKCPNYDRAARWAQLECRSYKIAEGFLVEGIEYVGRRPVGHFGRRNLRVVK